MAGDETMDLEENLQLAAFTAYVEQRKLLKIWVQWRSVHLFDAAFFADGEARVV